MRIIAVSDTHRDAGALETVLLRNPRADLFVHLGDGEEELDLLLAKFPDLAPRVWHVRGNCDYGSISPPVLTMGLCDGHKLLAVHGHLHGVKYSTASLVALAAQEGADIVLFGHTHERYAGYENGIYLLNPGSAGCPRDGKPPSYGYVDLTPAGVVTNHVELTPARRW